jgi:hypothetical protein
MTCECSHALGLLVLSALTRGLGIPDASVTVTGVPLLLVRRETCIRPANTRTISPHSGSFHDDVSTIHHVCPAVYLCS